MLQSKALGFQHQQAKSALLHEGFGQFSYLESTLPGYICAGVLFSFFPEEFNQKRSLFLGVNDINCCDTSSSPVYRKLSTHPCFELSRMSSLS